MLTFPSVQLFGDVSEWWTMAMANCFALATNLFRAGVQVVVIEGNALYTKASVNDVLRKLLPFSTV